MDPTAATPEEAKSRHPWVRPVVDYAGLASWAVTYFATKDMLMATGVLVGVSVVALAFGFVMERRIAPMPLMAGLFAIVFGGLTLVFKDPTFIKIKPTVVNMLFGIALLGGLVLGKTPLKILLGGALSLSAEGWRKLSLRYGLFFLFLAGLNEVVWRTQPEEIWVVFRMPGLMILTVLFAFSQVPFMLKDARALELAASAAETQD